ncbi:MAG: hypothetical protein MUO19_03220 [Dehalococcoidales bacterium]|nr:hypothetical protein [Dehalococcoidales bacterium]
MTDKISLIDQLIAEHKIIHQRTEDLENTANDANLLTDLKEAKETFVPGRLDQHKGLQKLESMLEDIAPWLDKHFKREETILLGAVEELGDRELISSLNSLLLEHADLRNRVAQSREHVTELKTGALARHRWDASANDMRGHLTHTRKLLEIHASMENDLFTELRRHLIDAK